MRQLTVTCLEGMPEVRAGDDVGALIAAAIRHHGQTLHDDDVVVVAQKVVSKAEGRVLRLATVEPSAEARVLAVAVEKDARYVQAVLAESRAVLRQRRGVLVVEDVRGFVMANAGIDRSNLADDDAVLLLPLDPDRSAHAIRARLEEEFRVSLGVIVIDSFGRAWRNGVLGTAIGVSGVRALVDARGRPDRFGRALQVTEIAAADAIAAAASLMMGEGDEGTPFAIVRGWRAEPEAEGVAPLLRRREEDLFR
jgi:coenzyme F420-0:L-glutamate ligase/coenzyme F420-1:gamma-L-glutamate ligase